MWGNSPPTAPEAVGSKRMTAAAPRRLLCLSVIEVGQYGVRPGRTGGSAPRAAGGRKVRAAVGALRPKVEDGVRDAVDEEGGLQSVARPNDLDLGGAGAIHEIGHIIDVARIEDARMLRRRPVVRVEIAGLAVVLEDTAEARGGGVRSE